MARTKPFDEDSDSFWYRLSHYLRVYTIHTKPCGCRVWADGDPSALPATGYPQSEKLGRESIEVSREEYRDATRTRYETRYQFRCRTCGESFWLHTTSGYGKIEWKDDPDESIPFEMDLDYRRDPLGIAGGLSVGRKRSDD